LVPHGIGCGCRWDFYVRFHLFVGAVSVPCGIEMILFLGFDKAMFLGQIELV
jgi:hypothetical protein